MATWEIFDCVNSSYKVLVKSYLPNSNSTLVFGGARYIAFLSAPSNLTRFCTSIWRTYTKAIATKKFKSLFHSLRYIEFHQGLKNEIFHSAHSFIRLRLLIQYYICQILYGAATYCGFKPSLSGTFPYYAKPGVLLPPQASLALVLILQHLADILLATVNDFSHDFHRQSQCNILAMNLSSARGFSHDQ
jgi:hypothetical protein